MVEPGQARAYAVTIRMSRICPTRPGSGAAVAAWGRGLRRGRRAGETPGIQMGRWPGFGRCPGGTPSVAAVLGPPSERASGTTNTVRVVRVHPAATARPSAVMATGSDRMLILGVAGGHNM